MKKVMSMDEAISHIQDGMTIMIGGFLACGSPHKIIDAIIEKERSRRTYVPASGKQLRYKK